MPDRESRKEEKQCFKNRIVPKLGWERERDKIVGGPSSPPSFSLAAKMAALQFLFRDDAFAHLTCKARLPA
jgi:hypothetical protein